VSTLDELSIHIEGTEEWPSLPPQDDLGEMPHFDFAMQRYFFDDNHRISLTVGPFKRGMHFFPDIALVFQFLPGVISSLIRREPVDLTFPESQVFLEWSPRNGKLVCNVGTFGTEPCQYLVLLDANQILSELKAFLEEVLGRAVTAGYVSKKEAAAFERELFEDR